MGLLYFRCDYIRVIVDVSMSLNGVSIGYW